MKIDSYTDQFVEMLGSDLFKALFDENRIAILVQLLKKSPQNIAEISSTFAQDRSVISRHLKQMQQAGIVIAEKKSRDVFYRINTQEFNQEVRQMLQRILNLMNACCP